MKFRFRKKNRRHRRRAIIRERLLFRQLRLTISAYFFPSSARLMAYGLLIFSFPVLLSACALRHESIDASMHPSEVLVDESPDLRVEQGIKAFEKGDPVRADALFSSAAAGFKERKNFFGQCDALLRSANVCLSAGFLDQADSYLDEAEEIAVVLPDRPGLMGRIYLLRGNFNHIGGDSEAALQSMQKALLIAEKYHDHKLSISVHNDIGNLSGALKLYSQALDHYRAAAVIARKSDTPLSSAIALANSAMSCIAAGDHYLKFHSGQSAARHFAETKNDGLSLHPSESKPLKRSAVKRASILVSEDSGHDAFPDDREKAESYFLRAAGFLNDAGEALVNSKISRPQITTRLNIGSAYLDLAEKHPEQTSPYFDAASRQFSAAVQEAEALQNIRLLSYACGMSGQLRRKKGQLDQAAGLTEDAIYWAQKAGAPELLYRWKTQYAQILSSRSQSAEAVSTYQDAIADFESIRSEFSNCYGFPRGELRNSANDLYLMYADELLRHVDDVASDVRQNILKAVREVVEKRKVYELREYFNDDCLGASNAQAINLDALIESAAIIYPIILPDRLEIIAAFPPKIGMSNVRKDRDEKAPIIRHYVTKISQKVLTEEIDLYRKALEGVFSEDYLSHSKRLYDWLIRPLADDLSQSKADTIVFVPDGPLRNIPMEALHNGSAFLIKSYAVAISPGLTLRDPRPLHPEKLKLLAVGNSSAASGLPALPGVSEEIAAISSLYDATVLLDRQFSLKHFEQALQAQPYNAVHIASHGKFSDKVEESFILTSDGRMTLNDLSSFVGGYRFRNQPLELLTLSACETAAGNSEAALGMAGIAVKTGARSALATLWGVDDQAAARLVSEFYRQLKKTGSSRAGALKQAKEKLIDDQRYSHPGYWSPFILINNWL